MTTLRSFGSTRVLAPAFVALAVGMMAAATQNSINQPITACVNVHSGELKILTHGTTCPKGSTLLRWNQSGNPGPVGPAGPPGPAGVANVQYVFGGMYPDTSVARAFCPSGTKVTGGGGFTLSGVGMQQSHPIADETGVVASGASAIGWQVAAVDFSAVQAYVVCVGP